MKKLMLVAFLFLPAILYSNPVVVEIYFNKSTDYGETWTDTSGIPVGPIEVHDYPTMIDVRSSTIYYTIWATSFLYSDTTHSNIFVTTSSDGGYYWQFWENGGIRVDDSTWSLKKSPVLTTDATGNVYAVWEDSRGDSIDIYFAKSSYGGYNWTEPNIRVNDSSTAARKFPSITTDFASNIYIVWQDNRLGKWDIYFTKSTNEGITWQHPDISITDSLGGDNVEPKIKQYSDTLYLVWSNSIGDSSHIYFGKSADYGDTWLTRKISNFDMLGRRLPSMDVSDSLIAVAWQDGRSGEPHIYCSCSTDGGLNWSEDTRVDDGTSGGKFHPSLRIDYQGNLYVAWDDHRDYNYSHIYFAKSVDAGSSWTSPNLLIGNTDTFIDDIMPSLAIDSQNICVAWQLEGIIISGIEENSFSSSFPSVNVSPNPASKSVEISYTIQKNEEVSVDIYDISGRLLRELSSDAKRKGTHILYWDRKESNGKKVKSGIYFLRIRTPGRHFNRKLILL